MLDEEGNSEIQLPILTMKKIIEVILKFDSRL